MTDELLKTDEVAQWLKADERTVTLLATSKRIPATKVGRAWRFRREDVEAYLKQNSNVQEDKAES